MKQYRSMYKEIQWEELLEISVERVRKLPVPLLVIGLGGTGSRLVNAIKATFAQRFVLPVDEDGKALSAPEHTAYLLLDTDHCSQGILESDEFTYLSWKGLTHLWDHREISRSILFSPFEMEWLHYDLPWSRRGMSGGIYRQETRLLLNRWYDDVRAALKNALTKITTPSSENEQLGRIEIVICAGICGGTGSGLFLDVPQIIRHIMATDPDFAGKDYHISGYIVMPDVSLRPLAGNPLADALRMNGYAALKELDFWMNVGQHKTPYTMEYGDHTRIAWKQPPYSDCYLLSGEKADGTEIPNAWEIVPQTVAEHLINLYSGKITHDCDPNNFAYRRYERICEHVALIPLKKPLPAFYGYRTLGTYSVRIPRQKMLCFEGKLLFDTFLPMRNEEGNFCASDALLEDGQTVARAQSIIGVVKDLHAIFAREVELPGFCNATAADKLRIKAMQQMQPRPHDQENIKPNPWVDSIVKPCASNAAEDYLVHAWKRFEDFCASVMSKPELGPFSLRDYLDHPDKGLIKEMEAQVGTWLNLARKFKSDLTRLKQACTASWPDFEHPPLLGKAKALEAYLQNLNNYYAGLRKAVFMEAHARAAQKLLLRMREYLNNGLKPICSDIEHLYDMFKELPEDDPTLGSDVLDFEILKLHIVQQFSSDNENKRITLAFLKALCRISLQTESNEDTDISGVTFLYREERHKALLTAMKEILNEFFDAINYLSMNQLMVGAVGEDVALQQAFMEKTADALMAGAQPLFAQNTSMPHVNNAPESFISVPANAPEWNRYFSTDRSLHAFINKSYGYDQINCITTWNSLPLSSYRLMPELRAAYYNGLQDPNVSKGVHLVWNGDANAEYPNNWCKLPDPAPFYYFFDRGDSIEEKAWNEARTLTERAIKSGMMDVDISDVAPVFNLHVFWNDAHRNTPVPASVLAERVNSILAQKMDPDTDEPLTLKQKLEMLKAFEAQADVTTLEPGKSSGCMARYMELEGKDINPWDTSISNDPTRKAVAKENHKALSEVMAAAILSANPRLLLAVKNQIEGFENIAKAKDAIEGILKIWTPRIAYAETFAKMIYHHLLKFSPIGAIFFDEQGNPTPVIRKDLVKNDLKNQPVFTKVCAYLADLPEDDPVHTLLERQAKEKEDEYDQKALNGLLTMEDCVNGIAVCERIKNLVDNELRQKKAGLTQLGADVYMLEKCIALLSAVTAFLDTRKGQLDLAKQMLD